MSEPPLLDIQQVTKAYDGVPALRGVSLGVGEGTIVCLLGPSGCGKTTLLRTIAGLEHPDAGRIFFAGRPLDGVPVHERGFGLMFQDYALFPHRDVAGNVAFGLRMQKQSRSAIDARVAEMLALVGLEGYERRRVYELSGGERQRVALARSLAPSPRLLMLDEPLGALDRALRERLLDDLRAILKRVGVTSIYVTHDQAEAFAIADWMVLMNTGLIEQQGPPEDVYGAPATVFAARFLGHANILEAHVVAQQDERTTLDTPIGRLVVPAEIPLREGERVTISIRPEAAELLAPASGDEPNNVQAQVIGRSFRGSRTRLHLRHLGGTTLEFEIDGAGGPTVGTTVTLALRPERIALIRDERQGNKGIR